MRWDESPEDRGRVKFAAAAEAVEGYGGRGLNGRALQPASGYLFPDQDGEGWWVVFQPWPSAGPEAHRVPGDVLACNDSYGDMVHVVVLASGVWEDDAEAAFPRTALPAWRTQPGLPPRWRTSASRTSADVDPRPLGDVRDGLAENLPGDRGDLALAQE